MAIVYLIVDIDNFLALDAVTAGQALREISVILESTIMDTPSGRTERLPPDEWLISLDVTDDTVPGRLAEDVRRLVSERTAVTVTVAVGSLATDETSALTSVRRHHRAKLTAGADRVLDANTINSLQSGRTVRNAPHDAHRDLAHALSRGDTERAHRLLLHWFRSAVRESGGDDVLVRRWLFAQILAATAIIEGRVGAGTASDWRAVCEAVPYELFTDLVDLHEPQAINRFFDRLISSMVANRRTRHAPTLELVRRYVDAHFSNADLRLQLVADAVCVSSFHVSHLFRAELNTTFRDYVTQRRLRRAQHLLTSTDWDMQRIAEIAGFGTSVQLRRVFARETGVTPSSIRRIAQTSRPAA